MKEDKIFNNKFNTGDVEYEVFGKISVKADFVSRDAHDEYVEGILQEDIYEIFINSIYYEEFSKNKKVSKSEAANIYYYFDDRLPANDDITAIEKFINIAEFMSIPYEVLYNELAPVYKEKLLRELDNKYQIFSKRKIKRLF
jgi:hypothetical protein